MSASLRITEPVPPPSPPRRPGKFYPGADGNRLHLALTLSDLPGRLPAPVTMGLDLAWIALVGWLAARMHGVTAGGAIALTVGVFSLIGDSLLLVQLPARRISFGPFSPQLLALALLRGLVALAVALVFPAYLGESPPIVTNLAIQLLGFGLALWGFALEPATLGVTRKTIRTAKLAGHVRMLQVGDLHVERESVREEQLQRAIDELQPDLIVFTGDFLSLSCTRDPAAWADVRRVVGRWRAPLGVFVVTGSPLVEPPDVAEQLLDGLPITWLRNQAAVLDPPGLCLLGITCTHVPPDDGAVLERLVSATAGGDRFTILLYHSPDLAPEADVAGVDLHLAGHTHGGQVRLPWFGAVLTSSLYGKRFEMGEHHLDGTTLYVARGIGLEGRGAPRVRLLCPPEVVLWDIAGYANLAIM